MSTAIISITEQGNRLALSIQQTITDAHCYTLKKYSNEVLRPINGKLRYFCAQLFCEYDNLVFIMATGIVARSIAPYLDDKTTDPAVVVMDDKGKHVISLLSGHLGGANALTEQLAHIVGGQAVITTASDVNQLPSVDMLAKEHDLIIDSMEDAKTITSLIVNRKNVMIDDAFQILPALNITDIEEKPEGYIVVTNSDKIDQPLPFAKLIYRNVVLGIGCKKDTSWEVLKTFLLDTLQKYNIDKRSILTIASIDIKKEETAIQNAAEWLQVPFVTYAAEHLADVEHLFTGSDFVKKQVGTSSVSAPAAWLAANKKGNIICEKEKFEGITLSLIEKYKHIE